MKRSEVFPSKYLGWEDLCGNDVPVTIESAEMEVIKDPKTGNQDNKLVLHFAETDKGMICNQTNFYRIEDMHGDDTEGWLGKKITLTTERTQFGNKQVNGLRVLEQKKLLATKPFPPKQQTENPEKDYEN